MLYEYECIDCGVSLDVVRSVDDRDLPVEHPEGKCNGQMKRLITVKTHLLGVNEQEYYSQALGQWVHGKSHARRIAKDKGLIEVGNEKVENHLKPKQYDYSDV